MGAHLDRAAFKTSCSRLTLLSPRLTFPLTLSTHPRPGGPIPSCNSVCTPSSPARYLKLATVDHFWFFFDRILLFDSLPPWEPTSSLRKSPLSFPLMEYKMASGPDPSPWAVNFSLIHRHSQPSALLSPSPLPFFYRHRALDPSFYGHGRTKCHGGRTVGSS